MSTPAYFFHGRSYADRELDPSLVQPANPFRSSAPNMDDVIGSTVYGETGQSLVFQQESTSFNMPLEALAPNAYLPGTQFPQQHLHDPTSVIMGQFATAQTTFVPMIPPPPMAAFHHARSQCAAQRGLHPGEHPQPHKRGWTTPILSDSSSPSSSISSMSDVAPTMGVFAFAPPMCEQSPYQSQYTVVPLSQSPSVTGGFLPESSLDPADLEDEEYQCEVTAWISSHSHGPQIQDYCPICRKTFNRACDFRRHVATIHVKREGGFPCTWPGCTRVMCRKDVLQRHIKTQHQGKGKRGAKKN